MTIKEFKQKSKEIKLLNYKLELTSIIIIVLGAIYLLFTIFALNSYKTKMINLIISIASILIGVVVFLFSKIVLKNEYEEFKEKLPSSTND